RPSRKPDGLPDSAARLRAAAEPADGEPPLDAVVGTDILDTAKADCPLPSAHLKGVAMQARNQEPRTSTPLKWAMGNGQFALVVLAALACGKGTKAPPPALPA